MTIFCLAERGYTVAKNGVGESLRLRLESLVTAISPCIGASKYLSSESASLVLGIMRTIGNEFLPLVTIACLVLSFAPVVWSTPSAIA